MAARCCEQQSRNLDQQAATSAASPRTAAPSLNHDHLTQVLRQLQTWMSGWIMLIKRGRRGGHLSDRTVTVMEEKWELSLPDDRRSMKTKAGWSGTLISETQWDEPECWHKGPFRLKVNAHTWWWLLILLQRISIGRETVCFNGPSSVSSCMMIWLTENSILSWQKSHKNTQHRYA